MVVHAVEDATSADVKSLIYDLAWVGGCRDPDTDPAFYSMAPSSIVIKRLKEKDR